MSDGGLKNSKERICDDSFLQMIYGAYENEDSDAELSFEEWWEEEIYGDGDESRDDYDFVR